jgi:hypothetical protein
VLWLKEAEKAETASFSGLSISFTQRCLAGDPNPERIKKLSQEELAKYCCEWFTYGVLKLHQPWAM